MLAWREVTRGLLFPEGPIALPDGSVVLVEMARRTLTQVTPDGAQRVIVALQGGPNGAAIGPDGRCYICNNGGLNFRNDAEGRQIPDLPPPDYTGGWIEAVDLASGSRSTLYRECNGIPLFAPNDLVFDAHGGFYFTDSGKIRARDRDRGAVFYASADGASIKRVVFPVEGANGIGLSADGELLYVAESVTGRLWSYRLESPGRVCRVDSNVPWLRGRMLFAAPYFSVLDSLAIDAAGNICVADIPGGSITVVSPQGELLERHFTDDPFTTNICFGGPNLDQAFVTLSSTGRLVVATWPRPGLSLRFGQGALQRGAQALDCV